MALVAPALWEPSADEDRVRRAAELWRGTATRLDCTLGDLAGTATVVQADHEGAGIEAFARWWDGLAGPGDAHLGDLVTACRSIADALDAYADALAEVRRALLEIAASIAASIAVGAALAWATAGVSAAGATATITALTLQATALSATFATRAGTIAKAVALHATIGALEGLATYAIVEPLRIAVFHPNDDPFGSYEPSEMALAAAGGALVPGWKAGRAARRAVPVRRPTQVNPPAPAAAGSSSALVLGAGPVPNATMAEVASAKLRGYVLNRAHPRGKSKARVIEAALGYTDEHADLLAAELKEGLLRSPVVRTTTDEWGDHFTVDMAVTGPRGEATMRTGWIVDRGTDVPRLVTAWIK